MALNQKYSHNEHIALTAPAAIVSGQPVKIGQYVGVAQTSAAVGERVTIWLDGSYMVPVTGAATEGQIIYISDAGELSVTAAGGFPFGVSNAAKVDADEAELEVAPFGMITETAAAV